MKTNSINFQLLHQETKKEDANSLHIWAYDEIVYLNDLLEDYEKSYGKVCRDHEVNLQAAAKVLEDAKKEHAAQRLLWQQDLDAQKEELVQEKAARVMWQEKAQADAAALAVQKTKHIELEGERKRAEALLAESISREEKNRKEHFKL